jgi:hypothetical protein
MPMAQNGQARASARVRTVTPTTKQFAEFA